MSLANDERTVCHKAFDKAQLSDGVIHRVMRLLQIADDARLDKVTMNTADLRALWASRKELFNQVEEYERG